MDFARKIAHPPRIVAEQSLHLLPDRLLLVGKPGFMLRQMQPAVMAVDCRSRASAQSAAAPALHLPSAARCGAGAPGRARLVSMLLMVARKGIQQFSLPAGGKRRAKQALSGLQIVRSLDQGRHSGFAELPRPCEVLAGRHPAADAAPAPAHRQRRPLPGRAATADIPVYVCRDAEDPASPPVRPPASSERRYRGAPAGRYPPATAEYPAPAPPVALKKRHPAGNVAGSMVNMQRLPLAERRMALQLDNHPFCWLRRW